MPASLSRAASPGAPLLSPARARAVYFALLDLRAGVSHATPEDAAIADRLVDACPGATSEDQLDAAIAQLRDYLHGPQPAHAPARPFSLGAVERDARARALVREIFTAHERPWNEAEVRRAATAAMFAHTREAREGKRRSSRRGSL